MAWNDSPKELRAGVGSLAPDIRNEAQMQARAQGGIVGVAGGQIRPDTQLERAMRLCKSLAELNARLDYINVKVRGSIPRDPQKDELNKDPELSLTNLARAAEMLLEQCHIQVNELAQQIGE